MSKKYGIKEVKGISHKKAWMIVRLLNGRELATPLVYGRKYLALARIDELNKGIF